MKLIEIIGLLKIIRFLVAELFETTWRWWYNERNTFVIPSESVGSYNSYSKI